MRILPPDKNSKRVRIADWLELQALTSSRRQASISSLRTIVKIETDDRTPANELDPLAEEIGEPEITNRLAEDLEDRVVQELRFRAEVMGAAYPFELSSGTGKRSMILKRHENFLDAGSGRLFYSFCLLDSGIREKLIVPVPAQRPLLEQIGAMFQICACLAVGGYLGVEVVSFGSPRAEGTAFLPALQSAWSRYGSYQVSDHVPHGFDDQLKDGGIDIIAWRHFPDGFAATLLMLVQVASGLNWKDKSVVADVATLKKWFQGRSFENYLPAICIPFPLWFDLNEPAESAAGRPVDFYQGVRQKFEYREGAFGVIFDRGRIAQSAGHASGESSCATRIDGYSRVSEVADWTQAVLSHLAVERTPA